MDVSQVASAEPWRSGPSGPRQRPGNKWGFSPRRQLHRAGSKFFKDTDRQIARRNRRLGRERSSRILPRRAPSRSREVHRNQRSERHIFAAPRHRRPSSRRSHRLAASLSRRRLDRHGLARDHGRRRAQRISRRRSPRPRRWIQGITLPGAGPARERVHALVLSPWGLCGAGSLTGQAEKSSAALSPHPAPKEKWRGTHSGPRATDFALYFQNATLKRCVPEPGQPHALTGCAAADAASAAFCFTLLLRAARSFRKLFASLYSRLRSLLSNIALRRMR